MIKAGVYEYLPICPVHQKIGCCKPTRSKKP